MFLSPGTNVDSIVNRWTQICQDLEDRGVIIADPAYADEGGYRPTTENERRLIYESDPHRLFLNDESYINRFVEDTYGSPKDLIGTDVSIGDRVLTSLKHMLSTCI